MGIRLGALGHGYYSIGLFFSISAPLRFVNWSKYENQSSLLSRHFMLWLYNGSFYLTDDGAENSQSAVHSGPVGFDNYFHHFVNYILGFSVTRFDYNGA